MKILNASFLKWLIVTAALFASPFEIDAATSTTGSGQSGGGGDRFGGYGFGGGGGGFCGRRLK